jgi:glutamate-5-semialdehyde dehydrogenase
MHDKTSSATTHAESPVPDMMDRLGLAARDAAVSLAASSTGDRNAALRASATALRNRRAEILDANATDMQSALDKDLSSALLDRLALDDSRVESMAKGLESIAGLPDPLGRILGEWERPNGLRIQRVAVPLGVIGIIYESRPNVTADAAGLCLKSGNAVILRGGSESFYSSCAIHSCMLDGLESAGIPQSAVQMVGTTDRDAVSWMLSSMARYLDVLIPRGGKSLIQRVQRDARVPVIGHLEGICHVYLHESADEDVAKAIVVNAKMRRTGICGAAETLLVDRAAASRLLPGILAALHDAGCEVRGDEEVQKLFAPAIAATELDWSTEDLDPAELQMHAEYRLFERGRCSDY